MYKSGDGLELENHPLPLPMKKWTNLGIKLNHLRHMYGFLLLLYVFLEPRSTKLASLS